MVWGKGLTLVTMIVSEQSNSWIVLTSSRPQVGPVWLNVLVTGLVKEGKNFLYNYLNNFNAS